MPSRRPDAATSATAGPYEWAVAEHTLAGEEESGDLWFVAPRPDGTLVAVVDGLGHGSEAAIASRRAVDTLRAHVAEDLVALVERCHRALRRTRGAVMALVVLEPGGALRWTGVGNVAAVVVRQDGRAREHAMVLGGVLGMQIPRLRESSMTLGPGDELVLATDGIGRHFVDDLVVGAPQRTAEGILRRHRTGRDDALVVVVRYRGAAA